MEPTIWIAVAVVAVVFFAAKQLRKSACDVPGPRGMPILGYLPWMGRKPELTLGRLRKEHGDLFQISLGSQTVIVLNTFPLIKEALNKPEFSDRPHTHSFHAIQKFNESMGYFGVAFFPISRKWEYLRRTTVRALNNLVVSPQNRLEHYTKGALDFLYKDIDGKGGVGSVRRTVFNAVNSVVGSMNFSQNLPPDSPVLDTLFNNQEAFGDFIATSALADFLPFLKPLGDRKAKKVFATFRSVNAAMGDFVRKHRFNPEIRDVQDAMEQVVRSDADPEAYKKHGFDSVTDVKMVAQDLFAAGTFTTTEHFLFFIRIISLHPETARKMREELERVAPVSDVEWISLDMKEQLPYVRAVQEEVFRFTSQVPFAISHWTTADTTLRGFRIPKGTLVLPNLWEVHRDPHIWHNPDAFEAERFLTEDGAFDEALARNVVPFSYGRRRCPGELMARRELFLLYANFARTYDVKPESFHGKEPFDCVPGFTRILQDADFRFQKLH